MSSARPVSWASALLYTVVLLAGSYAFLDGSYGGQPRLFYGGLAVLFAVELVDRWWYPSRSPALAAAVLLLARLALFGVVAAGDGAGLSWVLFVLVPYTAYFTFGRLTSIALGFVLLAATAVRLLLAEPGWSADPRRLSDFLMFTLGLAVTIAMAAVAVQERQSRVRLSEYASQLAELSATAERNRLARDIHDSLGHHLTAISLLLEKAQAFRDRDPAAADRAVADAHESARRALDDVRQSVRALRADDAPFDLVARLTELARQGGEGPTVTLDVTGDPAGYDASVLTALYRAAQEGITNARRHAAASRVSLRLAVDRTAAHLIVADDGHGFPAHREGLGLLGMRERVYLVGGQVKIHSRAGTGTRLTVTVPRGGHL